MLAIFASQDKWINPEVAAQFKKNMTAAGKEVTIVSYHADHAFAKPSNPKFNKEFAAKAHSQALTYLRTKFKVKAS